MVTVRAMTEAEIEDVAAIRVGGWQTAYAGILPQSYLDAMTVEADAERRRKRFAESDGSVTDLVAVDDRGRVVGWACAGPVRGGGAPTTTGELYALYVRPGLTGSGIGRTLIEAAHAHALARGYDLLQLWVLDGNTGARRFYERAGYAPDGAVEVYDYDGVTVPEVRYRRALEAAEHA
jgi:GNAT superfamily N-acetyltransferase